MLRRGSIRSQTSGPALWRGKEGSVLWTVRRCERDQGIAGSPNSQKETAMMNNHVDEHLIEVAKEQAHEAAEEAAKDAAQEAYRETYDEVYKGVYPEAYKEALQRLR